MLALDFPNAKDSDTLKKLLSFPEWSSCALQWTSAYSNYEKAKGDPWSLKPAAFSDDQKVKLRDLYRTRGNGGPIRRIRATPNLKCCPMCGSPVTGTLDHYLPREHFPEFSIFSRNLVPACSACNSSVKKELFQGPVCPERFLHPYYDKLAAKPIWKVAVAAPFEAPKFTPALLTGFSISESALLQFHIDHILGEQFQLAMATSFTAIPQRVRDIMDDLPSLTNESTKLGLCKLLRDATTSGSANCWEAALLRGLVEDTDVIAHLCAEANKLDATPII